MSELKEIVVIILGAILVENFVLTKFLGICPFLGVSKKLDTALGMGGAVIFVMTLASAASWAAYNYLLVPYGLEYLQIIVFILVIAALVQFVETVLKKLLPPLYKALGIYLPLITTNCAVLGVALLNVQKEYDLLRATIYGFGAATGFTMALLLFSGVRERVDQSDIPEPLKGIPIALMAAGLVSVAFFGFQGLF